MAVVRSATSNRDSFSKADAGGVLSGPVGIVKAGVSVNVAEHGTSGKVWIITVGALDGRYKTGQFLRKSDFMIVDSGTTIPPASTETFTLKVDGFKLFTGKLEKE